MRREADRPVHVTVLAAMALPVTVHEVATWEAVQPDRLEVAAAEAALNNRALPLAPADLQAARPDLWGTPKAAERDLKRREGDILTAETTPKPLIRILIRVLGVVSLYSPRATVSPAPAGRRPRALVPRQDGRAALEALVGPLAAFEVEQAPPPPPPLIPLRNIEIIPLPSRQIFLFDKAEEFTNRARAPAASTRPERATPVELAFDGRASGIRVFVLALPVGEARHRW